MQAFQSFLKHCLTLQASPNRRGMGQVQQACTAQWRYSSSYIQPTIPGTIKLPLVLAGLVMTLGPQGSSSALGTALQAAPTRPCLPPQLLQQVYALDQQGAAVLAQRQQALLAGVAGLQAYSAALRLVLGSPYTQSSHHALWSDTLSAALGATSHQVGFEAFLHWKAL